MEISRIEYWAQVKSIAEDAVEEALDSEGVVDDEVLYEHLNEVIDGHQWVIYYAYNDEVLRHCDNSDAWEDCYGAEDIGQLVINQGMRGARAVQAYFAMLQDVQTFAYELAQEVEHIELVTVAE